ncbi:SMI1/KNR4 family protein [Actinoplanes sp. L3-i22]|uniref:SMI1/KNR4 family protein n=1 Tax=Actinoplanes sp. L3-i22 TaxID=2836373 RepID=UPI001C767703|nr:SMI1/KNR4 family protein [Actinoplanes sp. L3-i22]BCY09510.1 hypothetical protein L3i22_045980 [Actinoplanes sp. L3-i22]
MTAEDRTLPAALVEAHSLGFFEDHDGHDFQPDDMFEWSVETTQWWHAWTGNPAAGVSPFRVFGRDGSGGAAAFWIRTPAAAIETEPMVFLGSEGELDIIAQNLGDYLWLLANGVGPLEMVDGLHRSPHPIPPLVDLARRHTGASARSVEAVIEAAAAELPALIALLESTTR